MYLRCGMCTCARWSLYRNVGLAQQVDQQPDDEPEAKVAATVNEIPVLVADVELRVRQALGDRTATEQARGLLQAEALERLIDQQKVLVQLQQRGEACTEKELDVELRRLQDEMERQEKTLDDYCQSLRIPQASLRRMLQWQLSWKRCRSKYLTDENLQRYFDRHHKEFDGTTLRVAQLLLKPDADSTRQQLLERALEIRREIVSGKMEFGQAARKYSQSPSGQEGGTLGWISRQAPMPEYFSHAAYQLDAGEVSEPVESPYGVHLIHCLEIKPGQKRWTRRTKTVEQCHVRVSVPLAGHATGTPARCPIHQSHAPLQTRYAGIGGRVRG